MTGPRKPPSNVNAVWHRANPMPKNAAMDQRIAWHLEHQEHCRCRGIPRKVQEEIDRRARTGG